MNGDKIAEKGLSDVFTKEKEKALPYPKSKKQLKRERKQAQGKAIKPIRTGPPWQNGIAMKPSQVDAIVDDCFKHLLDRLDHHKIALQIADHDIFKANLRSIISRSYYNDLDEHDLKRIEVRE